jgi:adenylosuccinate lyase
MISEGIIALAKIVRADLSLAVEGMINEHERDMRSWQSEWEYIGEICIMTSSILHQSKRVISGLVVKPENMKRNLKVTGGLICSEAVMLELARKMGRLSAHELVYELSMKAFEQNIPFKKCLLETSEVTKYLSEEKIAYLLDPANYVGLSALFVEKVVKSVRAAREKDAVDK